jgi:ribonuclease III
MEQPAVKKTLETLYKSIGYSFINPQLLLQALRHSSYVNERPDEGLEDNERLEFLGDAVLDLVISDILMRRFQDVEEGLLSKYRATMVDEAGLCQVALDLDLGAYIYLGRGEEQSGGRKKPSILANTLEALLGALYMDAGFEETFKIIDHLFSSPLQRIGTTEMVQDHKSLVQEYMQQKYKTLPEYRLVKEYGPAHNKTFHIALSLKDEILAEGRGKSKKEAEQVAARKALACLNKG